MNNIAVLYDAGQAVLSTFDLDEVLQFCCSTGSRSSCTSARKLAGTKVRISFDGRLAKELREPQRSRNSPCMRPT